MRFFAKPILFMATALVLLAVTPAQSAPPCPVVPSLLADGIPDDLCPQPPDPHEAFANMAWQTFKMLVWPASSTTRGEADTNLDITEMQGSRVFETYKGGWESFPAGAVRPLPWNLYPSQAVVCKGYMPPGSAPPPSGALVLASLNKFGNVTQPGDPADNDFGRRRLMAQNGSLVRYLASFNEAAFNYIQLHNDADLIQPADAGSITVKSAWIEMKGSNPDPSKFYVRSAWVQDPSDGTCSEATVGLVGLHIVHKTTSNPQWIWASFEHVDNVPLQVSPPVRHAPPLAGFTFNDGSGEPMPGNPPLEPLTPYNVERTYDIAAPVKAVNSAWQAAMKEHAALRNKASVWSNYELVVAQWAPIQLSGGQVSNTAPPCFVGQLDTNMANSTMETLLQSRQSCPTDQNLSRTCIGCHYRARSYDFIWAIPLDANSSPAAGAPRSRRSALSILSEITGGNAR